MNYYSGKDLARSFRTVRQNTLQIANDIPDEKYNFRPASETRSVGETLAHIASSTGWPQDFHGAARKAAVAFEDFRPLFQAAEAHAATLTTKSAIVHALTSEGERFASWLEALPDAVLGELVQFPEGATPRAKSRFEMIMGVKEHEMHHRAQLMVVQRMIGIVPHLTRARQQRQAPEPTPAAASH